MLVSIETSIVLCNTGVLQPNPLKKEMKMKKHRLRIKFGIFDIKYLIKTTGGVS